MNGHEKRKEKEMKFATQEQSTKSLYGTFNVTKDAIVADVQAKYKFRTDIAKAIRDRKKFEINNIRPVREIAKLSNAETQLLTTNAERNSRIEQKQKGLNIEYKASVHMFIECKCMLEENEAKAFSLIINKYCTKEMQNRVQTHPKYDTDLVDDPI